MKYSLLQILLTALLFSCTNNVENKKQNFVFILVDDLGWTDLGYSGSTFYESPNIDSLSISSIQFTNAYASGSVCSPSRASIMTGRHPARVNITDWIPGNNPKKEKLLGPEDLNELPLNEITLAEKLKNNGYKTFFAGKWHLGSKTYFPENQGFDINIGGGHMGHPPGGYYSPYKNPKLIDGPDGEYLTDRLTNESIKFLDSTSNDPFFLFLAYYTVHKPIQANKKHLEKFNKKASALGLKTPKQKEERGGLTTLTQFNPAYASMVYSLDENIGRLIKTLKDKNLYDNTTIIFTSDNGGLSTLKKEYNSIAPTSVAPLRGGKGWLYEGGIRVPLLIKPANYNNKNTISNEPVIGHDFYPTIMSLANIKSEETQAIDGKDLTPILKNNTLLKRDELFWHYPHYHGSAWTPGAAIRKGDWKLISFYETNTLELYNLSNDLSETNDLSNKYPEKVKELHTRLKELQQSMNANSVKENPDYHEKTLTQQ